jgi:uncharacterized protein YndB with AHSA1/START domain
MSKIYEGYLLIADITGYTKFLSESELIHAQDTLTTLLELLVDHTRPPFVISRLAGDAVISYGLRDNFLQGQTLIEKIEDTYVAFRKMIDLMVLNNTCQCNACANVSNLDLKFFFHFGTFGIQRIADHDELVGSDINLLHRLLKNSVTEKTTFLGYTLYTDAAIRQMGVEDLTSTMIPHSEVYEHLGEVALWVQDMHPVWAVRQGAEIITFLHERIALRKTVDLDMPREQVWDYLSQPEFRNFLIGSDRMEILNRKQGRVGPGSIYQCYHGDMVVPQTILEWHPFERIITREVFAMSVSNTYMVEYRLDPTDGGTRLTLTGSKISGPLRGRILYRILTPMFSRVMTRNMASFKQQIENDFREHRDGLESSAGITNESIREAAGAALQTSSTSGESG